MKNVILQTMFNMRWNQLQIQVNNFPDNVYAKASGNIISFSRKFLNDVKNGAIPKSYFFFVFLHELVHVAQQAVLSLEMTKEKLKDFIERERVDLEKEADYIAFHLLVTDSWRSLIENYCLKNIKKGVSLYCCQDALAQYWIVNGPASRGHFSEYDKKGDKLSHREEIFKNKALELNKSDNPLVDSWMKFQSSATEKGAHELFTVTAYRELLNDLGEKDHNVERPCNEKEMEVLKDIVEDRINKREQELQASQTANIDAQNRIAKINSEQEEVLKKYPEKAQSLLIAYVAEFAHFETINTDEFNRLVSEIAEIKEVQSQNCADISLEIMTDYLSLKNFFIEKEKVENTLQKAKQEIDQLVKEIDNLKKRIIEKKIKTKMGEKKKVVCFRTLELPTEISAIELGAEIERKLDLNSLIRGSSWNDRWIHDNVRFGFDYFFGIDRFLNASHGGSMQFLHSMECSSGDKKQNIAKILEWVSFCIDVYNNVEIEIKGKRKHLLDKKVSVEACFEYYSKKNPLFKEMVDGLINTTNTYKDDDVSYFFGADSYDPKSLAIGSVAHMIQDSFAASHSKRCIDPFAVQKNDMSFEKSSEIYAPIYQDKKESFEGQKVFRDYLKKKAMPLLLIANYKDQEKNKHAHADVFVNRVNVDGVSFNIPDDQKDEKIDDDKLIDEWLKVTCNASVARDCTEAFLYMVLMGYGKKDILDYVESLYAYRQSLPTTNSGLQYNAYKVKDSNIKKDWNEYNNYVEHLLCYNVKEPFVNRIEVFSLAITLLDKMMDSVQNGNDWKQLWLHVNEIIVEIVAATNVMCDDFLESACKKPQTEEMLFKRNVCLETSSYLLNLLKKINGVVSTISLKAPSAILDEIEIRMSEVLKFIDSESDCLKALIRNRPRELKNYLDQKKDCPAAASVA